MIIHSCSKLKEAILKLFNFIFTSSVYPQEWAKSIISVIFKSGDKSMCDNYRGIAISSCLGKLFAAVLNKRLRDYVLDKKLVPENQIGFMPGSRTSDHIFVLKCAIEKYIRQKKRLFVCFIDFRKAFDSVWHDGLFTKLQKLGIGGLFHRIIRQMYMNGKLCVRTSKGLTPFSSSKVGVRQGFSLSPLLFNLFLSDLPECLEGPNPVQLFSKSISHLLYADDLVLLSETANGLQCSLNSLHKFCLKWRLSVNTQK